MRDIGHYMTRGECGDARIGIHRHRSSWFLHWARTSSRTIPNSFDSPRDDLSNPGAFRWTEPLSLNPEEPHYSEKIVILVDESSMSQAEYTTMAFRAAHGAIVIGSTTSGADGNVSPFALPGGLHTMISGIGVFYPDKSSTQRIGIVPNIEARPTIAGIRAGRDEVLEKALRQILGRQVPAADIEKMARP